MEQTLIHRALIRAAGYISVLWDWMSQMQRTSVHCFEVKKPVANSSIFVSRNRMYNPNPTLINPNPTNQIRDLKCTLVL